MAENSDVSYEEILKQVKANQSAINRLHERLDRDAARMEQIHQENEPVRVFVADFDAATRVGRGIRSFVSWLVFVGGIVALVYVVVVSSLKNA